jgi:type IV secretory pathway VirB3-like protein
MGVSQQLMAYNFGLTGVIVFIAGHPSFLLVTIVLHITFIILTKKDPFLTLVLKQYSKQGDVYEPFPLPVKNKSTARPIGWGRDEVF